MAVKSRRVEGENTGHDRTIADEAVHPSTSTLRPPPVTINSHMTTSFPHCATG